MWNKMHEIEPFECLLWEVEMTLQAEANEEFEDFSTICIVSSPESEDGNPRDWAACTKVRVTGYFDYPDLDYDECDRTPIIELV